MDTGEFSLSSAPASLGLTVSRGIFAVTPAGQTVRRELKCFVENKYRRGESCSRAAATNTISRLIFPAVHIVKHFILVPHSYAAAAWSPLHLIVTSQQHASIRRLASDIAAQASSIRNVATPHHITLHDGKASVKTNWSIFNVDYRLLGRSISKHQQPAGIPGCQHASLAKNRCPYPSLPYCTSHFQEIPARSIASHPAQTLSSPGSGVTIAEPVVAARQRRADRPQQPHAHLIRTTNDLTKQRFTDHRVAYLSPVEVRYRKITALMIHSRPSCAGKHEARVKPVSLCLHPTSVPRHTLIVASPACQPSLPSYACHLGSRLGSQGNSSPVAFGLCSVAGDKNDAQLAESEHSSSRRVCWIKTLCLSRGLLGQPAPAKRTDAKDFNDDRNMPHGQEHFPTVNTFIPSRSLFTVSLDQGLEFPWGPKPFAEVVAGPLLRNNRQTTDSSSLEGHYVGVYFSAHWCPPCRSLTRVLVESYRTVKESGHKFEIVFVSADRSEESFKQYFSEMPWLAVPYSDEARRSRLNRLYGIQ
ncbi:nucleoredoxin isoform X1, partial [Lates japonicus]